MKLKNSELTRERFLIVLIITLLVTIWFRKGLMIGSGESGLPFYNPEKISIFSAHMWSDPPLGDTGLIGYAALPFYLANSWLIELNIPPFLLQAAMFWLIFIAGTLSIHKLASIVTGNNSLTRLSSSLFYIFNPVVYLGVLHRVQYPMIFFYGLIPLAFLIYYKGLKSRNFINLLILNLLSIPFCFVFVGPAFLIMYFFVLGSLSLCYFLISLISKLSLSTDRRINFFPLIYFGVFIILFIPINSWWLTPLFSNLFVGVNNISGIYYFNPEDNVGTFLAISSQLESILSVFRMFSIFLFRGNESSWGWIYETFPFVLLSFINFIAFVTSMLYRRKSSLFLYFIFLSTVCMFLMKGSNSPFGFISTQIIKSVPFLGVFRNPFEKISLMLPFAMAIPVGFGISEIIERINLGKLKNVLIIIILVLIFPVYMFVIVNGYAFTGGGPPADNVEIGQYVKVPDYYKAARKWLDSQPGLFRLLVLPIDGEGMTYKWEYGYAGVELSNTLFNQPAISLSTSQLFLPQIVDILNKTLLTQSSALTNLTKLLNVKYILVRDDIDYLARETIDPKRALGILQNQENNLTLKETFGKLSVFEVPQKNYLDRVFAADSSVNLYGYVQSDLSPVQLQSLSNLDVFINIDKTAADNKIPVSATVIKGKRVINQLVNSGDTSLLPFIRFAHKDMLYRFVRFKEELDLKFLSGKERTLYLNQLAGKRIAEAERDPDFKKQLLQDFNNTFEMLSKNYLNDHENDDLVIHNILNDQILLRNLSDGTQINGADVKGLIDGISNKIDKFMIDSYNKSIYLTDKDIIFRYTISTDGDYEILLPKTWQKYYKSSSAINLDVDGKGLIINLSADPENSDYLSLGKIHFNSGTHEVAFNTPESSNLVQSPGSDITISTQDKKISKSNSFNLTGINANSTYKISLEFLPIKGNVPIVSVIQDSDPVDKQGTIWPRFQESMIKDNYDSGWHEYTGFFKIASNTNNEVLNFSLQPWGNCKDTVKKSYQRYCLDDQFSQQFLKDSSVQIKNLKVERVYTDDLILLNQVPEIGNRSKPEITSTQINPAKYMVEVKDAKEPFYLVLSTAFDTRWKAILNPDPSGITNLLTGSMTGDSISEESHYLGNGYANIWSVKKLGTYNIYIEFLPERIYTIGKNITLFSCVLYLVFILIKFIKKYKAYD